MKLEWEDLDRYSKLSVKGLIKIVVHLPRWQLTCEELQINNMPLRTKDLKKAKLEAIKVVLDKIETLWEKTMYLAKHII